jgi:hypothetical protein
MIYIEEEPLPRLGDCDAERPHWAVATRKRVPRALRTAVRVIGGDPARLEFAATYAAHLGLEV